MTWTLHSTKARSFETQINNLIRKIVMEKRDSDWLGVTYADVFDVDMDPTVNEYGWRRPVYFSVRLGGTLIVVAIKLGQFTDWGVRGVRFMYKLECVQLNTKTFNTKT